MFESKYKWRLKNNYCINDLTKVYDLLTKSRNIVDEEILFHDPFLFKDMKKVVNRINKAINDKELIYIYGDYDADGITGTLILYLAISRLGGRVKYYIPNRFLEGYGPNIEAFKKMCDSGANLIITVDNGIKSNGCDLFLAEKNIDYIVTDHHTIDENLPICFGIIHPQFNEEYPYKFLSGAGVAFKIAHALLGSIPDIMYEYAAVGTYADCVDLTGENRKIVIEGISRILDKPSSFFKEILEYNKLKEINEFTLGFIIGPRINSFGRIRNAHEVLDMIINNEIDINIIEDTNNSRKSILQDIVSEIELKINEGKLYNRNIIIVYSKKLHEGVIGIAASKIVEKYNKPVIILTDSKEEGIIKGSARSLEPVNIITILKKHERFLLKYGGHEKAAGMSLKLENLDQFYDHLDSDIDSNCKRELEIDFEIGSNIFDLKMLKILDYLSPYGVGNQKPLFLIKDCIVINRRVVNDKIMIIKVKKDKRFFDCISFRNFEIINMINKNDIVNVVGELRENNYNGYSSIQLLLKDINCNHVQIFDKRDNLIDNSDKFNIIDSDLFLYKVPELKMDLLSVLKNNKYNNLFINTSISKKQYHISRDIFKKVYQLLQSEDSIDINSLEVKNFIKENNLSDVLFNGIIRVFFELDFVIINNMKVTLKENVTKKSLEESKTYRNMIEKQELYEVFNLYDTEQLLHYINNLWR